MLSEAQKTNLEKLARSGGWWPSYLLNTNACIALVRRGLAEQEAYHAPNARRTSYYRITTAGRAALESDDA